MHSSKPSCRCGPRGASPGSRHRDLGDAERCTREPISPDTGLERGAPGQAEPLRFRLLEQPRHHHHLPQMLDLGGAALHRVELAEDLGRFRGDARRRCRQHLARLVGGGVLRAAEPAGRRDRADVGQHRLVGCACAAACPSCGRACGRTNSRCGRDARARAGTPARPAPRSRRRGVSPLQSWP